MRGRRGDHGITQWRRLEKKEYICSWAFKSVLELGQDRLTWAPLVTWMVENLPAMKETWVRTLGQEDPLEEGMATHSSILGLPCGSAGKESACKCGRPGFDPWVGKIPWRREQLPTPIFWPGEFHGLYSPCGHKELDITEQLSLSVKIRENFINGNFHILTEVPGIFIKPSTLCFSQLDIVSQSTVPYSLLSPGLCSL